MNRILFRSIVRICRTYWTACIAFLVVGISQLCIGLYSIVLFEQLLNAIIGAQALSDITTPLLWYVGFTLANHVLIYLDGLPRSILANGSYLWAKRQAMKKVATIDYLAYQDLGTGQLVERIEQGASAFQRIFIDFYLALLRQYVPHIMVTLILIRRYDRTLFFASLGLVAILSIVSTVLMRALRKEVDRMLAHQERFAKFSVRGFMELVVFRINNRFEHELKRVEGISDAIIRGRTKTRLVQELLFTGFAILSFLLTVGVILQQANLVIAGTSTIGALVALTTLIGQVVAPISQFGVAYTTYKQDQMTFQCFADFLALPDDRSLVEGETLTIRDGTVQFCNVTFAYDERTVIHQLNITLQGKQTTALVGMSGAGKTTLVRLLLSLLKPDQGQVLVDGQDLSTVRLPGYYQQVAYISQTPPIFDGTIRENLVFDEDVDTTVIESAVERAGLSSLISRLPVGLDTVVGERGVKVSGGERQRLAFARLLIQQPKIVVMDEPTSSLDSITETAITQSLQDFLKGRTTIIIAHRLQTVQHADRILVLNEGQIVQDGDFASLVTTEGSFREMWEQQTG